MLMISTAACYFKAARNSTPPTFLINGNTRPLIRNLQSSDLPVFCTNTE